MRFEKGAHIRHGLKLVVTDGSGDGRRDGGQHVVGHGQAQPCYEFYTLDLDVLLTQI